MASDAGESRSKSARAALGTAMPRTPWPRVAAVARCAHETGEAAPSRAVRRPRVEPPDPRAAPIPVASGAEPHRIALLSPWCWDGWVLLHVGITAVLVWLSAILLLPTRTFDTSVSYALLDALAPEWAWSLVLGAGAGLGLWGLVTPRPFVRNLSCTVLGLLHTLIALCMASANPVSTAGGTYIILAFLALGRLVAGR